MTRAAITNPRTARLTAAGIHRDLRSGARPRIALANAAWAAVAAALLLSLIGIVVIATDSPLEARKQAAFFPVALLAGLVAAVPTYRLLRRFHLGLALVVGGLLVFVLIPAVPEWIVKPRNSARRWIDLGPVDFQPSELAKLAYVASLAVWLESRRNYRRFVGLMVPFALSFIPMGLILVEPDLGTAMLFLPTLVAMLIAAGARLRHLLVIAVAGAALAWFAYPHLRDHQKERIDAFYYQLIGDDRHEDGIGYQGRKAIILAGAGGATGVGAERASELVDRNKLPESHNDMVFAVVVLRWGVLGAAATWGLFLVVVASGLIVAARTNDPFGRLLAVGIVAVLFGQMTINTGMTIGVLPITGMNLPFVSYGGSSLVFSWMLIGLLFNVALRRPRFLSRESREFDAYFDDARHDAA